jgi:voltage-gated potassium channel
VLVRLTDPASIPSLLTGFWWSLQTVTTVGYGDVVPASVAGRVTAAVVMLAGLSFLAVTTAAVTNAFVEAAARRRGALADDTVLAEIKRLRAELEQLRAELLAASGRDAPRAGPGGASRS